MLETTKKLALRRIQVVLQVIAEVGQVVHRAEGGWVLILQRQTVVEEVLAVLVGREGSVAEGAGGHGGIDLIYTRV